MNISSILKLKDNEEERIINLILSDFGILDNRTRTLYFLTQVLFETDNFTRLTESLYYTTPERICKVWPSRFNMNGTNGKKDARQYVRNQQKLANEVYSNRMGNGNYKSGDGYKFRGRGAMHLTGRSNYTYASREIFGDLRLVENPDLVATDKITAIATAAWFWKNNGLNKLSDQKQFTEITRRINGSTATVNERKALLQKLLNQLT